MSDNPHGFKSDWAHLTWHIFELLVYLAVVGAVVWGFVSCHNHKP